MLTSIFIRDQIDMLEAEADKASEDITDICDLHEVGASGAGLFGNVFLGAAQPPCTFQELEQSHHPDPAFGRFRIQFALFLTGLLRQSDSPVQIDPIHLLSLNADDSVSSALSYLTAFNH